MKYFALFILAAFFAAPVVSAGNSSLMAESFTVMSPETREPVAIMFNNPGKGGVLTVIGEGDSQTVVTHNLFYMNDKNGKTRLYIALDENGAPMIVFKDKDEKTTKIIR